MTDHLRLSVEYKGERKGVIEFRKHYAGYLRGKPGVAKLRAELMHYTELQPTIEHVGRYAELLYSGRLDVDEEQLVA
jgi:tRNA-dihydrouridine synthase B